MDTLSTSNAIKAVIAALNTGTPNKKYPAQKLIQDMATAGNGIAVCTTAASEAAKVVTVSNFILLKNGIVSVRFQNGIKVANATLNVSGTGAKAIQFGGVNLPADAIPENTMVMLQYDGTAFQIVGIANGIKSQDELLVDLALPSGLLWATRNIDVTKENGFAASPYQYECSFFSWGNTDGHNPISTSAFQYNWGTANDGPYASTPGATIDFSQAQQAGIGFDAARQNLGAPWRMPTTAEFAELFNNIIYIDANGDEIASTTADKRVNYNGVMGLRLKSKNNNREIFFPCSGNGNGQSWHGRGSYGNYWSSSLNSATHGRYLSFGSGGVSPQINYNRFYGFAVRPVQ